MNKVLVRTLWMLILLLGLGLLGAQVITPIAAGEWARQAPEIAHLVVPYSVLGILGIACFQVALFAIARLLGMVDVDNVFSAAAVRWVNVIIWAAVAFVVLTLGVLVHMSLFVPGGGGPTFLYMIGALLAGVMAALLMLVMRELLTTATANRAELAEVI